jgi:predicted RNase H-like HicB family nuclease
MQDSYPIIYPLNVSLKGPGFLIDIQGTGWALVTKEGDASYWAEGVHPGGLSAGGDSPTEAAFRLQRTLRTIILDLLVESRDIGPEAFLKSVAKLFGQISRPAMQDWCEAVEEVRAGRVELDGVGIRKAEENKPRVQISIGEAPAAARLTEVMLPGVKIVKMQAPAIDQNVADDEEPALAA